MVTKDKQNQGVATRVGAAQTLALVFEQGLTLDEALDKTDAKYRFEPVDRRLVHAICGFVFRNLNTIDGILRQIMNRTRPPSPKLLHQLLRVGVAQLLYMDIAPHAAVHASVSATGSLHLSRQKGLVNAVLRSVQRQLDTLRGQGHDSLESLPEWLRNRWVKNYGAGRAAVLIQNMRSEAPIDLTLKDPQASLQWGQTLQGDTFLTGAVRVRQPEGHITSWSGFAEGAWWVQDLAASFPIRSLSEISKKSVLELCAAPGGKTLQLVAAGATVTALDISASRMQRVIENLNRVMGEATSKCVRTVISDALAWNTSERFDIVVLDAPCSSTGTLRRHPEHPWIHSEKSIERCMAVQANLLRHAAGLLRPDGILLYCTCSLEPEEGEEQVEEFLCAHKDFKELKDIPAEMIPYINAGRGGIGFRTFPDLLAEKGGMDGFFFARLQKQ